MNGINKMTILGTLGADPEMKYTGDGKAVANISVATSEEWTDKNTGQKQKSTDWHKVVIFGKLAEIAGQYLKKGSQVYLEGKLKTRKWQDQNGQDRYTTEVVLSGFDAKMQMLGGGNSNQEPQSTPLPVQSNANIESAQNTASSPSGFNPSFEPEDGEIPF